MAVKKQKEKSKSLYEEIEITSGINTEIIGNEIIMKKGAEEIRRKLNPILKIKIAGAKVIVECSKSSKKEKKIFGSNVAHIKNMITGLTEGFYYKLQIATVHFPVTTEIDKTKNEFVIKNFLGEKKERRVKLIHGVDIKVIKDVIELRSSDIEKAGQVAANLEKATKITHKDRRIFQDGIYMVEKPGRKFI